MQHLNQMVTVRATSTAAALRNLLRRRPATTTLQPQWIANPCNQLAQGLWTEAELAYQREHRYARRWAIWHYVIGLLGVVLAAAAGFGSLADLLGKQAAAWVAVAAAIAIAVGTFLQSDSKRQECDRRANGWDTYRDDITRLFAAQPDTPDGADGPDGWESVIKALQARAAALRAFQPDPQTRPRSWPRPRKTRV